jgi:hypothetical protein
MAWLTGKLLGTDALGREKKAKYDKKPKGIGDVIPMRKGDVLKGKTFGRVCRAQFLV